MRELSDHELYLIAGGTNVPPRPRPNPFVQTIKTLWNGISSCFS
jgi:hypothetical protein